MPIPERPNQFLALGEDVTAAVEARIQQAATQSLLAQVFLSIDNAVAIAGSDGRLLMTNPFTDRFLGYPARSLPGRSALDLVAPEAYDAAFAAWERQVVDGATFTLDLPLVHADGVHVPVGMRVSVVETPDRRRFRIITARPSAAAAEPAVPGRRVLASRIRLAGLDAARAALGERWVTTADRAAAVAEQVLRRQTSPQDSVKRLSDVDFVIGLAFATEQEAAWRVAMAAQDIRRALMGIGETPATAHVTALTGFVMGSGTQDAAGRDLSAHAGTLEAAARASLRTALAGLQGTTEPIHRLDGAPGGLGGSAPGGLSGGFIALHLADERRIQVALTALPFAEVQELDLDARLLDLAVDRLTDPELPKGHRLLVPVSFDLFDHRPALDRYVTAGRLLDRAVRPRLVLVLTGMPATTPRARLMDCIIRLRPYCGMIALEVDGPDTVPPDLSLCGAPLVVMNAAAVPPSRLVELLAQLRMSRTQLLLRRAGTMAEATALLAAGVDLVSVRPPETVE